MVGRYLRFKCANSPLLCPDRALTVYCPKGKVCALRAGCYARRDEKRQGRGPRMSRTGASEAGRNCLPKDLAMRELFALDGLCAIRPTIHRPVSADGHEPTVGQRIELAGAAGRCVATEHVRFLSPRSAPCPGPGTGRRLIDLANQQSRRCRDRTVPCAACRRGGHDQSHARKSQRLAGW